MKKTLNLKNYFFSYILAILLLSTISISLVWLLHEVNELKKRQKTLNSFNLDKDKEYVQMETQRVVRNINFLRNSVSNHSIDSVKKIILQQIAGWHTNYGGYLFINTYDGQALIFDGKLVTTYKNISDMIDPSGLRLFDIEKQAIGNPQGIFMQYLFKKMQSDQPEPKISYIMSIPDWNWLVGFGIYRSDSQEEINIIKAEYVEDYKRELILIILIFLCIASISYILVFRLNRKISAEVNQLIQFFDKASQQDDPINFDKLRFSQFNRIGKELNKLIKKRVSLKNKLLERENRIQSIFNAAENIAFIFTDLDPEGLKILDFSPGAENMFNFERIEILNQKIDFLLTEQGIERLHFIRDYILRGKSNFRDEIIFIRKDGAKFSAIVSVHPLLKDQEIIGTIIVLVDITKRKVAEEELIKYQANLEKLVDERTLEIEQKNKELMAKNDELERFNDLFVGREFRIKELREKIKTLEGNHSSEDINTNNPS